MQRNFASNLALCATLSQALASRLLMQEALEGLNGYAFTSDSGEQIIISHDADQFEQSRDDLFNVTPINIFAQTMQQTDIPHSCTYVMDRHKTTDAANFYSIVNETSQNYLDEEFPTLDAHYHFDGGNNETGSGMVSHSQQDTWHRVNEDNYFNNVTLFGNEGIRPQDIRQGEIGNCWFLSGITALAEYPGRIEKSFLNKEISAAGVYGVQMYALGAPITVMVDDQLPLASDGRRTRYSKVGTDGAVWGPIMEKAFSKFHGNYAKIVAGDPVASVSTMNGSPYLRYWTSNMSAQELYDVLATYDLERALMQAGTHSGGGRTTYGLVKNHAYVMLGVAQLNDGTQLIKMRNPWGVEGFKGQYSDANMSSDVKSQLNHTSSNDGTFYMLPAEFKSDVQYVGINYNTENWSQDYFLALDDNDNTGSIAGKWNFCGAGCYRYEAKVKNTSGKKQQIHVSANTWRSRSYPETDECKDATYNVDKAHSIYLNNDNKVYTFWNDSRWMDAIEFDVDEVKTYQIELDLDRKGLSKDWSVTAWGESGEVQVTVAGKGDSSAFPHVKQDNTKLPEDEGKETGGDGGNDNEAADASAKKAEDAAQEAASNVTNQGYIMQTILMKSDVVSEHALTTATHLLTAQLYMEKAQKALEDAIICCGLTFIENGEAEETTLEQLAGYLKIAQEAMKAAEVAYKAAKDELKLAQEEKQLLDAAVKDVKDLADSTETARKTAGEELEKIKSLTETPEQQAALARAQKAYDEAVSSKKEADLQVAEAESHEIDAAAALKYASENEAKALKHVTDSNGFIQQIQDLIDERMSGDDDAEECADDIEDFFADIEMLKKTAEAAKAEIDETKQSIADYAAEASLHAENASKASLDAEAILTTVKSETECGALDAAHKAAKAHQITVGLAQNGAAFAHNTAQFELDNKFGPALNKMNEQVDKMTSVMEEAKDRLTECDGIQDTVAQKEAFLRATQAYEAIAQMHMDCVDAEKQAMECLTTATNNVGEANTSNTNAIISKQRIDAIITEIKLYIKSNCDDGDDDCEMTAIQEKADQHLTDSTDAYMRAQKLHDEIMGHGNDLDMAHSEVKNTKEDAEIIYGQAYIDKKDMAKLEGHKADAIASAKVGEAALKNVKSSSQSANQVLTITFSQLMMDVGEIAQSTEDHMATLDELAKSIENAKNTLSEAIMKQDMIDAVAKKAGESVSTIAGNVQMAEMVMTEVDEIVVKIESLIENLQNGTGDEEDDVIAEEAADECEKAQEESKVAMENASEKRDMVDMKKAAIGQQGDDCTAESTIAFKNLESAQQALEEASQQFADDEEALNQIREDIEALEVEADDAVANAESAYTKATELKTALMAEKESMKMYVDDAEAAKKKAEDAYNIAKQHSETPTQVEAEEKARNALAAATDNCMMANDYLMETEDMASKAETVIEMAMAVLSEAQKIDFEPILGEIDDLIENTQTGGGTAMENWLETLVPDFTNACNSRSVKMGTTTLAEGTSVFGAAHQCENKKMFISVKGRRGVKDWTNKVTEIVGYSPESKPTCIVRNLNRRNGFVQCKYYVNPQDAQKFAIGFEGIGLQELYVTAKLQAV